MYPPYGMLQIQQYMPTPAEGGQSLAGALVGFLL